MPQLLGEVKIIDKRYSKWDEKKSDLKKGYYVWISKEFIDPRGFDKNKEWKFTWWNYDPENNFKKLMSGRAKYGYEPVKATDADNHFVPDGAVVSSEGYWVFSDVCLVKSPLIEHLKRRERDINLAKKGGKALLKGFSDEMRAQGASLPDDIVDKYMGEEVDPEEVKRRSRKKIF